MQGLILAAGKGDRMRERTATIPKPLIKISGIPLIERVIQALPESINELIIVVKYRGDQIRQYCGVNFCGRTIDYVWQGDQPGTAAALIDFVQNFRTDFS